MGRGVIGNGLRLVGGMWVQVWGGFRWGGGVFRWGVQVGWGAKGQTLGD